MRPRIGVTSGIGAGSARGGDSWQPYAEAIERAGGEAVHLGPATRGEEVRVIAGLRGVLFTGGKDIDLRQYPNPPVGPEGAEALMAAARMRPEPERDVYELPLLAAALDRDLPVLGICRGCQLLHVALGGRLILDLPSEVPSSLRHAAGPAPELASAHHSLRVLPGTLLEAVLPPAARCGCNSRHHQAVRPGGDTPTRVAAVSPDDGVIEAIEAPGRRWVLAVQWHPEHRRDHDVRRQHAPLFDAFVEACR